MADTFTAGKLAWLEAIAGDRELKHSAVRVAIILAKYLSREQGCAWPSVDRLASESGLQRRAVHLAIDALIDRHHLEAKRGGGRAATSRYWPILGGEKQCTPVHPSPDEPCTYMRPNSGKPCTPVHASGPVNGARFDKKGCMNVHRLL